MYFIEIWSLTVIITPYKKTPVMKIRGKLIIISWFNLMFSQKKPKINCVLKIFFLEALNSFDGGLRQITGPNATAVIFASFPAPYLSNLGGFIDQV